ncbi:MAG: sugar phosphate isomerase/epimerase family protein [Planctomycetota bacterium]|jgi:sugar phosphate isomerase/epimerase
MKKQTRRQILKLAGFGAAASVTNVNDCWSMSAKKVKQTHPTNRKMLKFGLASYTFRKFKIDETLTMTKQLGLKYICLKSFHLPLESSKEQILEVVSKVKKAGIELYGGGVIQMKNEVEINRAFEYAKLAGMKVIIAVPNPELLELVNRKIKEYDIKVAIHNHGPTDKLYPTPESAYERIKKLDKRFGLCIDIGHTQRAGVDPSEAAEKFAERLLDVHIKDVTAAKAEGKTVEIGRGIIDIPKFVRTLQKIKYSNIASFEYEKDATDPLAGLAESVGYVRGILAAG